MFDLHNSDLARLSGLHVITLTSVIIIRELIGAIENETFVKIVFLIAQLTFDLLQICAVSLLCVQILSIFYSASFGEWRENLVVQIHRIVVLIVGGVTGSLVCYMGAGMCHQSPLYFYLLNQDPSEQQSKYKSSFISVISSLFSFSIILVCQIAIETKRFLVKREELKADRLVEEALKQMSKATSKLERRPLLEQLGIDFLPSYVLRAWEEESSTENVPRFKLPLQEIHQQSATLEQASSHPTRDQAIKVPISATSFYGQCTKITEKSFILWKILYFPLIRLPKS